jgi:ech hydrogenase subunit A
VAKSLLFLSVGSAEHRIDSRDIEAMDSLIVRLPVIATAMIIGIAGMFLPPLGMLISKWVVLGAFIDAHSIISPFLILSLAFGSSLNLFFWMKWVGKIISPPIKRDKQRLGLSGDESIVLCLLSVLTIAACFTFPQITTYFIEPYIHSSYVANLISQNYLMLAFMMLMIFLLPVSLIFTAKKPRKVTPYLSGRNAEDPIQYQDTYGVAQAISLKNYYFATVFPENRVLVIGGILTSVLLAAAFVGFLL